MTSINPYHHYYDYSDELLSTTNYRHFVLLLLKLLLLLLKLLLPITTTHSPSLHVVTPCHIASNSDITYITVSSTPTAAEKQHGH